MVTEVYLSTTFHPQSYGHSERTIQTLEDMLMACALEYLGSLDYNLSLVKFAYNSSYHASIGVAPYDALYVQCCRTPVCWEEVGEREPFKVKLVHQTKEIVSAIRKRLQTA